jgi:ketosteroid isomerase-like protein
MSPVHAEQITTSPVETVRRGLDAFLKGDVPYILERIAPDCQWSGSMGPDVPYAGQFTGPQGALKFLEAINANLDIKTFAFDRYVADGEHVVALGNWSGVVRKTGKSYDARLALYFQVREGKFLRFTGYEDTAILAAAVRE